MIVASLLSITRIIYIINLTRSVLLDNNLIINNKFIKQSIKFIFQLRYLVFILGGVGAQVLAISLVMLIFKISVDDILSFLDSSLVCIFIYSNLFMILVNIVPYYTNMCEIKYPKDALQITRNPFLNEGDIQTILATSKIMEEYKLYEEKISSN